MQFIYNERGVYARLFRLKRKIDMLNITKAILHIFDMSSEMVIASGEELDAGADGVFEYLEKHIEKSLKDAGAVSAQLEPEGDFMRSLLDYQNGAKSFKEWSEGLSQRIADFYLLAEEQPSADFVAVDFVRDEERYVGLMIFNSQKGYTHQIVQGDGFFRNEIIRHYGIMPGMSQKVSSFIFVRVGTWKVKYFDKKRSVNGDDVMVIPDKIISCTQSVSPKEAVKRVKAAAERVAENNGGNSAEIISRAKTFLMDNAEMSDKLDTEELSRAVFPESQSMADEFVREVRSSGVPQAVNIDREYAARAGRVHKIKTDTGIEISIPSDFFNNPEYVEFINNSNGTISIAIKNVGSIVNK